MLEHRHMQNFIPENAAIPILLGRKGAIYVGRRRVGVSKQIPRGLFFFFKESNAWAIDHASERPWHVDDKKDQYLLGEYRAGAPYFIQVPLWARVGFRWDIATSREISAKRNS